jgi:hypothetical protein
MNSDAHTHTDLISRVRVHDVPFYREFWGDAPVSAVPSISAAEFQRVPLSLRRYKNEKSLVKVIRSTHGPFLSEWSFEDIKDEPWGVLRDRPMVYLTDPYEAVEKAMWCYLHNRMPLIGENAAVACSSASSYKADSFILDATTLKILAPYFQESGFSFPIALIGSAFDIPSLLPFSDLGEIRLILSLPETGVIAEATLENPLFAPAKGVSVEYEDGLAVSKGALLTTPIIRYRTGIQATAEGSGFKLI